MSIRSVLARAVGSYVPVGIVPQVYDCEVQVDVSAGAADVRTVEFPFDVTILGFFARVDSEAVGAVTAGGTVFVVSLDHTPASTGARAEKATVSPSSVSATYALGEIMETASDLAAFDVLRGEPIHFEHKTQAVLAGQGSVAGTVKMGIYYIPRYFVA